MLVVQSILLAVIALSKAGDPLKEVGQFVFCQKRNDYTPCESRGSRICLNEACVSICVAFSAGTEHFYECNCKMGTDTCPVCCQSNRQACAPITNFSGNPELAQPRREFCYDQCPYGSSGKTCEIFNQTNGVCHRGICRDPCSIVNRDLVQCGGVDHCKVWNTSEFCCKFKDQTDDECHYEDEWRAKLKYSLEHNSRGGSIKSIPVLVLFLLSAKYMW